MAGSRVSFSDQVRAAARRLGFDAVGITRASVGLDQDFMRYKAFVREGMHGEMGWLAQHASVRARLDGEGILAGAKSVVCVARRYGPSGPGSGSSDIAHHIARYARGRDYHVFLRRRVRRLAAFVRGLGSADRPVAARPLCDEEPLLERAWAVRAGLGFIGKNGMLIVPGLGSMVLLGEVVTTLELNDAAPPGPDQAAAGTPDVPRPGFDHAAAEAADVRSDVAMGERCGACTRCLEACPTKAFSTAYVLDPRRCVSYLTIEHRSAVAPELREGMGTHLFGCDDCQTVCPFNAGIGSRALRGKPSTTGDGDPFAPLERWSHVRLESLLSLDESSWRAMFQGTPLKRAGRAGIARNAAIVLGNRNDARALAALRTAADGHDDAMVREAAAWAVARIEQGRER
jgi:epoxyqueuosine reductase